MESEKRKNAINIVTISKLGSDIMLNVNEVANSGAPYAKK